MAKEGHEPRIQWALVDGEPRHVSDFYDLRHGSRPEATCPQCDQPLSMRLGDVRIHHYAHLPGSTYCAATQPESALHQNVKFHLAAELAKTHFLTIHQVCQAGVIMSCDASRDVPWLEGWDRVEVEYRLDSYRPDIALLAGSTVIGAVEVLVTHAVEPAKAEYLQGLGVSWLEIRGTEELYTGETAWRAGQPMPFMRLQPDLPCWMCDKCTERAANIAAVRQLDEQRRHEEAERWRNNHKEVVCYKVVDYFWPSGRKYREVFAIVEEVREGARVGLWLVCRRRKVCNLSGLPDDVAKKRAAEAYRREITRVEERGAKVDSPMTWKQGCEEVRLSTVKNAELLDVGTWVFSKSGMYPYRYAWWNKGNKWFLPKANEDINWDDPGPYWLRESSALTPDDLSDN